MRCVHVCTCTSHLSSSPVFALLPVLTCSEASSMETAYRMVQTDSEALQSRLHALEDELKTVKRELQEARDLLTEEADIEPGRPRTESVSAYGQFPSYCWKWPHSLLNPSCSHRKTSVADIHMYIRRYTHMYALYQELTSCKGKPCIHTHVTF